MRDSGLGQWFSNCSTQPTIISWAVLPHGCPAMLPIPHWTGGSLSPIHKHTTPDTLSQTPMKARLPVTLRSISYTGPPSLHQTGIPKKILALVPSNSFPISLPANLSVSALNLIHPHILTSLACLSTYPPNCPISFPMKAKHFFTLRGCSIANRATKPVAINALRDILPHLCKQSWANIFQQIVNLLESGISRGLKLFVN